MKLNQRLLVISLFVLLVFALPLHAQTAATGPQQHSASLATLPESDAVVYVNTSRIINDALPRVLPEKEMNELRKGQEQAKVFTGIDIRNLEYVVLTMRFNKPTSSTSFPIPDAMLVVRGDFDAKRLIGMAVTMASGKLRQEEYGAHTMYRYSLIDESKPGESNPFMATFSEIALTNLDASTLAVGNPAYVKAALDAADGRARIKPETLASVLRDTNVLISATGAPVMAFAKSFGLKMVDNPDPNCVTRFGEYYLSLSMSNDAFKISGALNADNPLTASMVKNLFSGLMKEGKDRVPEKSAKTIFDQIKLFVEGDEVMAEASIPQEMAAKFVREMLAPKPPKATTTETKVTKPKPRTRRTRRRT